MKLGSPYYLKGWMISVVFVQFKILNARGRSLEATRVNEIQVNRDYLVRCDMREVSSRLTLKFNPSNGGHVRLSQYNVSEKDPLVPRLQAGCFSVELCSLLNGISLLCHWSESNIC